MLRRKAARRKAFLAFRHFIIIIPKDAEKSNAPGFLSGGLVAADIAAGVGEQTVVGAAAAVLIPAAEQQLLAGLDAAQARALDAVAPHAQRIAQCCDPPRMGDEDAVLPRLFQGVDQRVGLSAALRPALGRGQTEQPPHKDQKAPEPQGEQAFSELCDAVDGMDTALRKSAYAVTPGMTASPTSSFKR